MLALLLFNVNKCAIIPPMRRKKFAPRDWVRILYGEYEGRYGKVSMMDKEGRYGIIPYNSDDEPQALILLEPESLEKIRPFNFPETELKKFLRGEKFYSEYEKKVFPPFNIKTSAAYSLTAGDIAAALGNINKTEDCLEVFKQWFWVIINIFYEDLDIESRRLEEYLIDLPLDDDEMFAVAYGMTERLYWGLEERFSFKEEEEKYVVSFEEEPDWDKDIKDKSMIERSAYKAVCDDIISRVESYEHNKELPRQEWIYSDSQKKHIVESYEEEDGLENITAEEIDLYRRFVTELEKEGDVQALKSLAWGYYDGNAAFSRNFFLSEKYLMKLYLKTGDPFAANSLGYIYYYGRTNNGIPDYKKAFSYFSAGALAGVDESIYKAADMLIYGRGTPQNIDVGLNMIIDGYKDSCSRFCRGEYDCKFADYALRMGNICRDRLVYNMSMRDAYKFYLEADLAIKKRRSMYNFTGDETVELRIGNELKKIKEELALDENKKELKADFPIYINQLYEDRFPVKVTLKVNKDARSGSLKIERYRFGNEIRDLFDDDPEGGFKDILKIPETILSFPELSWAMLTSELTYYLEDIVVAQKSEDGESFFSDGFRRNENTNALEFYSQGELVGAVEARWYIIKRK